MNDVAGLKALGAQAETKGILDWELYAECSRTSRIQLCGKVRKVEDAVSGGMELSFEEGSEYRRIILSSLSYDDAIVALGGKPCETPAGEIRLSPPPGDPPLNRLKEIYRGLEAASQNQPPSLLWVERTQFFLIAGKDGQVRHGRESHFTAHIDSPSGKLHRESDCPRRLLDEIDRAIKTELQGNEDAATPWPAPSGPVPIHWSARSVAKLVALYARAFEGDLIASQQTFLCASPPLPSRFDLYDAAELQTQIDHEGNPRADIQLTRDGKPLAVVTGRRAARQLKQLSSGHARREHLRAARTVTVWSPSVTPRETLASTFDALDWGVWVSDLVSRDFDLATGEVTVELLGTRLIHQGKLGERLEGTTLRLSIVDLLAALRHFEAESVATGIVLQKSEQSLLIKVTAPRALSTELPLGGSVPPSHYW